MSKIVNSEEWLRDELKRAPPPFVGMLAAPLRPTLPKLRRHSIPKKAILGLKDRSQAAIDYFVRCELTKAGFKEGNVAAYVDPTTGDQVFTQEIKEDEDEQETTEWIDGNGSF